jgi:hypothetical protein
MLTGQTIPIARSALRATSSPMPVASNCLHLTSSEILQKQHIFCKTLRLAAKPSSPLPTIALHQPDPRQ